MTLSVPRLLNAAATMVLDSCETVEARDAVEAILAWPDEVAAKAKANDPAEKERQMRASWGMTPDAEAGQAAMMRMAR